MLSLTIKLKERLDEGRERGRKGLSEIEIFFALFFIENEEDRECTSFERKMGTRFFDRGGLIFVPLAGLLG